MDNTVETLHKAVAQQLFDLLEEIEENLRDTPDESPFVFEIEKRYSKKITALLDQHAKVLDRS